MAVITELIDAGLQLKRQGNLRGAIEHFRQLQATYPGNARIMFELAETWTAFKVPEQALPLYQELLTLSKGQGLPPKDMPRLYTRLGATLFTLGEIHDALAIIDEGLRLHPSYRPLRVWRIFTLSGNGADRLALLDALELMLESLAPSRWDIFEDDIVAEFRKIHAEQTDEVAQSSPDTELDASRQPKGGRSEDAGKPDTALEAPLVVEISQVEDADDAAAVDLNIPVEVKEPKKKSRKPRRKKQTKRAQMGKRAVRIDISAAGETAEDESKDDEPPASASALNIPVDVD